MVQPAVARAGLPFFTRETESEAEVEVAQSDHDAADTLVELQPWTCEACMSVGNVDERCRTCLSWRSEQDRQSPLEKLHTQRAAETPAVQHANVSGAPRQTRDSLPEASEPEPEPEPKPKPELELKPEELQVSVGRLCRVLPENAAETMLALIAHSSRRQGSSLLSKEQRQCCGKVGVAVHVDSRKRVAKLQFTGDLGSHFFPCELVTVHTDTDAEQVAAEIMERHRAEMQRQAEEARQLAEERRQQLVQLKELTVDLLNTATVRAMSRLAERERLGTAATCIAAHYRGFVARRMQGVLVADRRKDAERAARKAEAKSAADDMSKLLAAIDKMEQKGSGHLGWSAENDSDQNLRAAAAGIDSRVRPGGGVSVVQLGPLWVPGTAPHNRLVTALLDEAVRTGGGRVLFRAPRSGILDLSGGGAAAWRDLRVPRGPRQVYLTSLDLSGARLEDSGAAGLASGIFGSTASKQGVCALHEIRLADCGLGPRGVASIAACLEACPAVRLLDLRGNAAGVDGGHSLAAAVSHPHSMLSVLVFNLNTAVAATTSEGHNISIPAAPLVPWSRDDYQNVVQAFTEALPASALTHLDIGYASTCGDRTLNCLRTAALPVAWVNTGQKEGSLRRKMALPRGSTGASNGSLWLGLRADSFHESIAIPLTTNARCAFFAAQQRLAWAVSVAFGAQATILPPCLALRVAVQMGRPMVPDSVLRAEPWPTLTGLGDTSQEGRHHYRCCLAASVRQGPEMDSPLLGRSLQVGEVIAALEVVAPPGSAARLRFRIPSPPLLGMTAWVSLRSADGTDILRPLEDGTNSLQTMNSLAQPISDAVALRSGVAGTSILGPEAQRVSFPIEGDRREAVDAKRRAALSSAAARHLSAILLRQRSEQSHATRAEFLIAFIADRCEMSPPRRRRPRSAGGLDSAPLVEGVVRQLKKSSRWLIVTSSDEIRNGIACADGLRLRIRIHDAKKVHRRGDQVTLRVSKNRVASSMGNENSDVGGSTSSEESAGDVDDSVQWETVVECEPGTEWLSQVAAVASRLLLRDCPLADKIGTGWACLRSLFLHKERQQQAEELLRTTVAESQDALAKLGVGGQAQKYRASLEERRQASIRNASLQRQRLAAATNNASMPTNSSGNPKEKVVQVAIPHPLARAEDLLQYAVDTLDIAKHSTCGVWHVAHKRGASVLAEPVLDAQKVCHLPQGTRVEILHKQPTLVELPPERVVRQPPSKSELTVRRHVSLLRTARGWIAERLPENDSVVLALLPWESLGGIHGGEDVLRTLRRKEVERLTVVVDNRRSAATAIERWWRRHIVQSRVAIRRAAIAEVQALQGLLTVNLSRPIALAPTIALHIEDQAHVLERGLVEEVSYDTKKSVRFVRPGSAASSSNHTSHRTAGLLRRHRADHRAPPRSSFASELHSHVSAAAAVWGGGEPTDTVGDSLGWLHGGSLSRRVPVESEDPALGLAMTTEIAGLTRTPSSPAMAAALRSDLATRRHPLRTMKAKLGRLEAGAVAATRTADLQASRERQSQSIFRSPGEQREITGASSEAAKRRRRKKAQEAQAAELRRLTGEMDLALEKDIVKRTTRLSRTTKTTLKC